jgi:nicotinamide riboside kinase
VQHFVLPGVALAWQAQHFRKVEWENRRTHWHETVSSALNLPFLKEVAQNFFVLDGVKRKNNIVVNPTDT